MPSPAPMPVCQPVASRARREAPCDSGRSRRLDAARAVDHADALYRAACALTGSAHDAEDLVQETYARVLARPRSVHATSHRGYLMTALRHTFFDDARRKRRRTQATPIDELVSEIADDSSRTQPEQAFAASELFAEIAALPEGWGDVVTAVDVAGLTYREAALALDVPQGTVMSRLYRARARLASRLAETSR